MMANEMGAQHNQTGRQNAAVEDLVLEDLVDRGEPQPAPKPAPKTKKPVPTTTQMIADEKERQMSSYMTHELRAPLTSIRSALGIMEMQLTSRMSAEEAQILKMATRNADRLNGLINDIMDFTKIRAGKMRVAPQQARPEDMINDAVESLRSWAVSKGIRLTQVDGDGPLPRVNADRSRTVQVLTNLLSNAIKFTPAGGKIEVSARLGSYEHTGTVEFRVKDSGPGIPPKDLTKIFRTFEQSATGMKEGSGTGLGLTLSKAMVELQGGRIWAESWKGLGAAFLFTLPIFQGDTTQAARPYPKKANYSGLFVKFYHRLNAVVTALFA
ncbi:MAG: HAMP domain-containing sensor histidine kinase [Elusimicrobiota bacterium]